MSQYFQWMILTALTGSPIASAAILVVFWLLVDRVTLGILPDPIRALSRLRKRWRLEQQLKHRPHDRKARLELAEQYLQQRRYPAAVEVLKPAIEQGEDDVGTIFAMGVACLGAGHHKQGEALLENVAERQPGFRVGEVNLARGRFRLQRSDWAGAQQALQELVATRKGTVEGRVLLARALRGAGNDGAAALMRDQAWDEYVAAPRFQRRQERWWAWRARPSRPLLYAAVAVMAVVLFARFVAPALGSGVRGLNPYARGMPADQSE